MLKAKEIDREIAKKKNTREVVLTPEAIMAKYFDAKPGPNSPDPKIWFDAALRNAPKDLATRQAFATWALEKGKLDIAKEQAEAILKLEESDVRRYGGSNVGHMLHGLVALWEKRWLDAEKDFTPILLQSPNDFGARNNLALALVEQSDSVKDTVCVGACGGKFARQLEQLGTLLSTLAWVYFRVNNFDRPR